MRRWIGLLLFLLVVGALTAFLTLGHFRIANVPDQAQVMNREVLPAPAFDLWGESIGSAEASNLINTGKGEALRPEAGAVPIRAETLAEGRRAFYAETFGNEFFFTDIMGMVDGPLTLWQFTKALVALGGRGTTNLQVTLGENYRVGDRLYRKGEKVDTGIDVPKGSLVPLGLAVVYDRGHLRAGITCAACHSTVDRSNFQVIEGAVNADLNSGILLAMATNSAAYFTHADREQIERYAGPMATLPPPARFEEAVDRVFASWAPGNFDSTIDLVSNPSQIPDSFTKGDFPYGWSGFAAAGPFKGLSAFTNNVHAQNTDSLGQAASSLELFDVEPETYVTLTLRNAARKTARYRLASPRTAVDFLKTMKPQAYAPGIDQAVPAPSYPKVSLVAPDGVMLAKPGEPVWEEVNAMAAWQNTLVPPSAPIASDRQTIERGRRIFEQSKCTQCHDGPYLTNNRVLAASEVGTDPSRAKALAKTSLVFSKETQVYPFTLKAPLPDNPAVLDVPTADLDPQQLALAWAHGTEGGYKVPALRGLYWSAPYLHDGSVGISARPVRGPAGETIQSGVSGFDPKESLRALIDREIRSSLQANYIVMPDRMRTHMTGQGHEFWIDKESGHTSEDQDAVIAYLFTLR